MSRRVFSFCVTVLSCVPVFFDVPFLPAVELLVEADRDVLYEGERIAYRVTVIGEAPIPESALPDLQSTDDYRVDYHGRQDRSSQSYSNVNGRQSQSVRYIAGFTYEIQPLKPGRIEIPPPRLEIDGGPLTGGRVMLGGRLRPTSPGEREGAVVLDVQPEDRQDVVLLGVEAGRSSAYPLQPFDVTLTLQVKGGLPGEYAKENPLGILVEPPQLRIPWVEDAGLAPGLRATSNRNAWLETLGTARGGVRINDLVQRSPFPMDGLFSDSPFGSMRQTPLRFAPPARRIKRPDASGKEVEYWEYRFTRTFVAERIGVLDFGPCTIKGAFAVTDPDAPDRPKLQKIYAMAPAVRVTIRDVPRENRPAGYIGAFGKFDWNVDLEPRNAHRGQPLTLTLSLLGQGSTDNIVPPDLNAIPEVASRFRVYDKPTTEQVDERGAVLTYTIRPTVDGDVVFPSIPVSYFDVDAERFVTLASDPIPISVARSDEALAPAPTGGPRVSGPLLLTNTEGIFANRLDPSGAYSRMPGFGEALCMIGAPFLVWIAIAAVLRLRNRDTTNGAATARRRHCFKRVRRRLAAIRATSPHDFKEIASALQSAIAGLTADWANLPEQGIARADIELIFNDYGVAPPLAERFLALLETLDAARFGGRGGTTGPDSTRATELLAEAEDLCERLREQWEPERENRAPGKRGTDTTGERDWPYSTRSGTSAIPFGLALGVLLPVGCSRFSTPETTASDATAPNTVTLYAEAQSAFDEADALASDPDSPEVRAGFEKAARLYGRLSTRGVANGTLFYNEGNAWARAGDTARAVAAYRRALRFQPLDTSTRFNLSAVLPPNLPEPPASWVESVLFWQNLLGYRQKYLATLLTAWMCSLLGIASLFMYGKVLRRCAILAGVAMLLMGVSLVYDHVRFDRTRHAVVAVDAAVARKGNSLQYEPRFTAPLAKGTEAVVVEHRGRWVLLRFADRQEAWLPDKEVVVY